MDRFGPPLSKSWVPSFSTTSNGNYRVRDSKCVTLHSEKLHDPESGTTKQDSVNGDFNLGIFIFNNRYVEGKRGRVRVRTYRVSGFLKDPVNLYYFLPVKLRVSGFKIRE